MNEESGKGPDDDSQGSWANEQLPMIVRRDLLDRELRKVAARHGAAQRTAHPHEQREQGQTGHPSADAPSQDERAE